MMKTTWFLVACAICVSPAMIAAQDLIRTISHAEAALQTTAVFESDQNVASYGEALGWAPLLEIAEGIEYTTPSPAQFESLLANVQDLDNPEAYTEELAQAPLLEGLETIETADAAAAESGQVASAGSDAADSDRIIPAPDDMTGKEVTDLNGERMGTIINVDYAANLADVELSNGSVLGLMMDTLTELADGVVAAELTCEDALAAAEQ